MNLSMVPWWATISERGARLHEGGGWVRIHGSVLMGTFNLGCPA